MDAVVLFCGGNPSPLTVVDIVAWRQDDGRMSGQAVRYAVDAGRWPSEYAADVSFILI